MAIMLHTLAIGMPGLTEWIIIGALGLLIFGKRLPEVGRSLGKGIVEFKKGLKGVEEEVETASDPKLAATPAQPQLTQQSVAAQALPSQGSSQSSHKFDPYTGKPIENSATA